MRLAPEVAALAERLLSMLGEQRFTGSVTIHWRDGVPRTAEVRYVTGADDAWMLACDVRRA